MARTSLWLLGVLLTCSLAGSAAAEPPARRPRAEAGKKSRNKARKERKERKRAPQPDADERRETASSHREGGPKEETSTPAGLSAAQKAAQDAAQGANAQIVKEGDTSVKVMSFSGLDIEGRLKSPQLLYFVSRVHAEFDRPKLPHRSFMPELKRSGEQEPLR